MAPLCRICLTNKIEFVSVSSLKNKKLMQIYKKLTNKQFNARDGRPRTLCCYCYQKLMNSKKISEMAQKSEQLFTNLSLKGLMGPKKFLNNVTKQVLKHKLGVMSLCPVSYKGKITDESSQGTVIEQTSDDIKEEMITEQDNLVQVESVPDGCTTCQLISEENNKDDVEELRSNSHVEETVPDDVEDLVSNSHVEETVPDDVEDLVSNSHVEETVPDDVEDLVSNSHVEETVPDDVEDLVSNSHVEEPVPDDVQEISSNSDLEETVPDDVQEISSNSDLEETVPDDVQEISSNSDVEEIVPDDGEELVSNSHFEETVPGNTGKKVVGNECGKKFKQYDEKVRHMRRHPVTKARACQICPKPSRQNKLNNGNVSNAHSEDLQLIVEIKMPRTGILFDCTVCDKQFKRKGNLNNHMRIHTG